MYVVLGVFIVQRRQFFSGPPTTRRLGNVRVNGFRDFRGIFGRGPGDFGGFSGGVPGISGDFRGRSLAQKGMRQLSRLLFSFFVFL